MKYIFYVIVSVLLLSCSSNKQTEGERQAKTLSVLTLQKDSIIINSEYPARIEGKINVDIRPQAEGYIEKILVEEGMYVKAGQSLFKIDDRIYIKTLEFSKWLGIQIPTWLENDLYHANNILDMSVKACVNVASELIEFCSNKNLPIGFNIESIAIRKEEIEASVELLNQVKDLFRN